MFSEQDAFHKSNILLTNVADIVIGQQRPVHLGIAPCHPPPEFSVEVPLREGETRSEPGTTSAPEHDVVYTDLIQLEDHDADAPAIDFLVVMTS